VTRHREAWQSRWSGIEAVESLRSRREAGYDLSIALDFDMWGHLDCHRWSAVGVGLIVLG
jgi:hypothetical protein